MFDTQAWWSSRSSKVPLAKLPEREPPLAMYSRLANMMTYHPDWKAVCLLNLFWVRISCFCCFQYSASCYGLPFVSFVDPMNHRIWIGSEKCIGVSERLCPKHLAVPLLHLLKTQPRDTMVSSAGKRARTATIKSPTGEPLTALTGIKSGSLAR